MRDLIDRSEVQMREAIGRLKPGTYRFEDQLDDVGPGTAPVLARVAVTIGDTSWNTSVFPHKESGGWLLPVKAAVRKAEGLAEGDAVTLDWHAPAVITPQGRALACEPIPPFLMDMVRAGGLLNQLRTRFGKEAVNG